MISRVVRTLAWVIAAGMCTIPLQALSVSFPPVVRVVFALYGVFACVRPRDALIVLAGLGPVIGLASGLAGGPFEGGRPLEAAVLILLAGSCVHAAFAGARGPRDSFEWALTSFAAIALASLLARGPVIVLTVGHDSASAVWALFGREYFNRPYELNAIAQTALLVEGAALAALAAWAARTGDGMRFASALVLGAAGAAVLSLYRLLEIALRQAELAEALSTLPYRLRVAPAFTDLNAAGSYFALLLVLAVALAGRGSVRGRAATAAVALLAAGLWLSGSRIALGAALAAATTFLFITPGTIRRAVHYRPALLFATAALLVTIIAAPFAYSSVRNGTLGYSVFTRVELFKTGVRMFADRPVFGIGTTQFYDSFARYAAPALLDEFRIQLGTPITKENAHNNFLQILSELGILGFGAFMVTIGAGLRGGVETHDRLHRGAALAALAYLLTCLAGHPLLTPPAAYPFWMVLGLTAGLRPVQEAPSAFWSRLVVVGLVALAIGLPWRMAFERREAHLDGVTFGFSDWQLDTTGTRFQSAGGRATIFVPHDVRLVRLPLKSPDGGERVVTVELDGRPAGQLRVPAGTWLDARLPMPTTDRPRFRRLDIIVEPGAGDGRVNVGRPLMVGPG